MATRQLIRCHTALVAAPLAATLASLAGCAAIGPPQAVVAVYGEHVSHITQHSPFAADPTNYGYQTLNLSVTIEARHTSGPFLTLADGYNLTGGGDYSIADVSGCPGYTGPGRCTSYGDPFHVREYGALAGPREVFSARLGWHWVIR